MIYIIHIGEGRSLCPSLEKHSFLLANRNMLSYLRSNMLILKQLQWQCHKVAFLCQLHIPTSYKFKGSTFHSVCCAFVTHLRLFYVILRVCKQTSSQCLKNIPLQRHHSSASSLANHYHPLIFKSYFMIHVWLLSFVFSPERI